MPETANDSRTQPSSWSSDESYSPWSLQDSSHDLAAFLEVLIGTIGARRALKQIKRSQQKAKMANVRGGVMEIHASGYTEAALETDEGRQIVYGQCDPASASDLQAMDAGPESSDFNEESAGLTPDALLDLLVAEGDNTPTESIIEAELTRFDASQQQRLLPVLWSYILTHRSSNNTDELIATGSAIRKYIALMPMDQMNDLAVLLDSRNRSPLPLELELEVAKMIYRNYEVYPPASADSQPLLAENLWQMAKLYADPRMLLRDKYSAVASLAIEAIVAMRSDLAADAWALAMTSPHRWFGEIVCDDLAQLSSRWDGVNVEAAQWLTSLRRSVINQCAIAGGAADAVNSNP